MFRGKALFCLKLPVKQCLWFANGSFESEVFLGSPKCLQSSDPDPGNLLNPCSRLPPQVLSGPSTVHLSDNPIPKPFCARKINSVRQTKSNISIDQLQGYIVASQSLLFSFLQNHWIPFHICYMERKCLYPLKFLRLYFLTHWLFITLSTLLTPSSPSFLTSSSFRSHFLLSCVILLCEPFLLYVFTSRLIYLQTSFFRHFLPLGSYHMHTAVVHTYCSSWITTKRQFLYLSRLLIFIQLQDLPVWCWKRDIILIQSLLTSLFPFHAWYTFQIFCTRTPGGVLDFKLGSRTFIRILGIIFCWHFYFLSVRSSLPACTSTLAGSPSFQLAIMLVNLTSFYSAAMSTKFSCLHTSLIGGRARRKAIFVLSRSDSVLVLHMLLCVSIAVLENKNFQVEQVNRKWTITPLWAFHITISLCCSTESCKH